MKNRDQFHQQLHERIEMDLRRISAPLESIIFKDQEKRSNNSLQIVQKNLHALERLISDVVRLGRLSSGDEVPALSFIDFGEYLRQVSDFFSREAEKKGVLWSSELPVKDIGMYVDTDMAYRIFAGLLGNAISFTEKGGKVAFGLEYHEDYLLIHVQDHGIGIVQEKIPHIFDPYYQEETHVRLYQATGVRMAVIKECCDQLNIEISVSSRKFEGTRFELKWPIWKTEKAVPDYCTFRKQSEVEFKSDATEVSEERIGHLTKDPDTDVVIMTRSEKLIKKLEAWPVDHVQPCTEAEECYLLAQKIIPEVIFFDGHAGVDEAQEILQYLRSDTVTSHIPLVVLLEDVSLKLDYLKLGVDLIIGPDGSAEEKWQTYQAFHVGKGTNTEPKEASLSPSELFIQKLCAIIRANLDNPFFGVSELSDQMFMSRTQLHRKVKAIENKSVSQFVREYKLELALDKLRNSDMTIAEIAYAHGFNSPAYFSRSFMEKYKDSPSKYRSMDR
jgi:AraC-like DNA-binding protein